MDDDDENPGSHPATSSSYHDDLPDDLASVLESEFDEEDRQQQMNQIANLMGPLYNDYTRAFAWLADKDRLDRIIYTARHTPKGQTGMQCMFVFWAFKRLGLECTFSLPYFKLCSNKRDREESSSPSKVIWDFRNDWLW
jgi:hypothetical protein